MKKLLRLALGCTLAPAAVFAVYAPIPDQDQGKAWAYVIGASAYHDSNIFGSATGEIDSMVYNLSASISYNGSLSDQTFVSAGYELSFDHVADRPGKQNLASHTLTGRIAHAFSSTTNIDINELYQISKNPQSLLAGIPLNTDQSFKRNQFDLRFATAANRKTGIVLKYRNMDFAFDAASLAAQLDRMEQLLGVEADFAFLPETKLVGEYRFQDISYDTAGALKDKQSNFLLVGFEHKPGEQLLVTGRAGFEDRQRDGAPDSTAPFIEFTARYTYGEDSFFAAGYSHLLEEASDVARFTDTKLNRIFANVQHRLSGLVTASTSLTYEPSQLQGRTGVSDVDEDAVRLGLALVWLPTKNWTITTTFDLDRISSDDSNRDQDRTRFGVSARLSL